MKLAGSCAVWPGSILLADQVDCPSSHLDISKNGNGQNFPKIEDGLFNLRNPAGLRVKVHVYTCIFIMLNLRLKSLDALLCSQKKIFTMRKTDAICLSMKTLIQQNISFVKEKAKVCVCPVQFKLHVVLKGKYSYRYCIFKLSN